MKVLFILIGVLNCTALLAQPDFTNAYNENNIRLYRDAAQTHLFYYLPGEISMGYNSSGRPDFNFLMMRYTGTAVYNDAPQNITHHNIITMRMLMKAPPQGALSLAKKKIESKTGKCELRPLPLSQLEAMLVFTQIGAPQDSAIVQRGELAAEGNSAYSNTEGYWQERYFTIFPDDHTANLLFEAFSSGRTAISFTYAFYSRGKTEQRILDISSYGNLPGILKKQFDDKAIAEDTVELKQCLVKADAFAIRIDSAWLPQLIKKIDLNDAVPPGYAVLNIRNYDFENHLREDLYEKTIEVEAVGAGGDKVHLSTSFNLVNPDVSSINFRFKYAVRLNKPYQYRIRELLKDGRETISEWKTISEWSPVLDITSKQL